MVAPGQGPLGLAVSETVTTRVDPGTLTDHVHGASHDPTEDPAIRTDAAATARGRSTTRVRSTTQDPFAYPYKTLTQPAPSPDLSTATPGHPSNAQVAFPTFRNSNSPTDPGIVLNMLASGAVTSRLLAIHASTCLTGGGLLVQPAVSADANAAIRRTPVRGTLGDVRGLRVELVKVAVSVQITITP